MFNYIVRRCLQMAVVLFFSSAASYALLNLAPGGPLTFLTSIQKRLNQEDIARIRAYFELDLYLPYRFSRWLVGWPRGPIAIGGQQFLGEVVVGCRQPLEAQVQTAPGKFTSKIIGCREGQLVTIKDLANRPHSSRGVLFGDFGPSWQITRDRPVSIVVW